MLEGVKIPPVIIELCSTDPSGFSTATDPTTSPAVSVVSGFDIHTLPAESSATAEDESQQLVVPITFPPESRCVRFGSLLLVSHTPWLVSTASAIGN